MPSTNHYINACKTNYDWHEFKQSLEIGGTVDLWEKAFHDYYKPRINERYLNPVNFIQERKAFLGEGFAVMAILCSLIEFIESTYKGKIYRNLPRGQRPGIHEYSNSSSMFISFLVSREPFKSEFNRNLAKKFYKNIRCGILHEASAKDGWRVRAEPDETKIVDGSRKIVYRHNFYKGIVQYIDEYGNELKENQDRQRGFIRKFDRL